MRVIEQHARLVFVALACVVFVAALLPLNVGLGANAEEAVGLIDVAPERWYPAEVTAPSSETSGRGFRTSDELPVWGYENAAGDFTPLMIDGHVGALPFYGAGLLARAGGLTAARLHSTLLAVVAVLLIFAFARRVGGDRVGVVAALLAGTSPHLLFVFSMVRPDEQVHSFAHLAAVLAAMAFAARKRPYWLYAAGLLFGLGLAAKNTALWALVAVSISALCFRLLPRARARDWSIAAALFVVPLVPQLLYVCLGDSTGAMSQRVAMVSSPWDSLAPSGLAASVSTFAASIGHGGTLVGGYIAGAPGRMPALPGVGFLVFVGVLVAVAGTFFLPRPVRLRAFGAGLGLLLLQHFAFYYRGEAYYELLAPWIPIALAVAGVGAWKAAAALRSGPVRKAARGVVVAAGLLVFANNGVEIARYHEALAGSRPAMFDRGAQELAAAYLVEAEIERPFTTTYGAIGVYELHTRGRVRPVHLFPYFRAVADGGPAEYRAAWVAILGRLGPGRHVFLLSPSPSPVEVSPCRDGAQIARQLAPAVRDLGGQVRVLLQRRSQGGQDTLVVAEVDFTPTRNRRR